MTKHKVLVVDNSPVILKIVSSVLEKYGCDVQTAGDGLEALDLLTLYTPDIIFTDLVMPKIDGAKFCRIVRNTPSYKDLFLVVLSGIALEDDMNILELGADICIAKGPASTMKEHIHNALHYFESGTLPNADVEGLQGLYPREVTRELLVNKRHNGVVFRRMTEGALELDNGGRIVRANPTCCTLFRRPDTEMLGTRFVDLLPEENREVYNEWIENLTATDEALPLVFDYSTPVFLHGRQVTFNLVPVFEEEQLFIIGILQDVTPCKLMEEQQRTLEKELEKVRKLDAMATMASGIAHDFNNLLTIINGNVEMARVLSDDDEVDLLLAETSKALQLTTGLIRQFTTFSDNYLPSKTRVCVDELLAGLLENELAGTTVNFQLTADDNLHCVNLDSDLIIQVFQNIIFNAVEAMDGRGLLSVNLTRVDGKDEADHTGHPMPDGDFIRVSIRDTGSGIDPHILEQVFDPYFSTKQKGTQKGMGLGLTIAHAIVKKHGGVVRLEANSDAGCTACIYLPVERREQNTGNEIQGGTDRFQILIMDDEELMLTIATKMFEYFNCRVTAVEEGMQAVRAFKEGQDGGASYDLVLLDLQIDDGMNGVDAAEKIHTLDSQATLVAMSGNDRDEVMIHFNDYHFVAAVAKPFSIDKVESLMNTYAQRNTG
ncbi:MAG: response regulator [Desulfobulbaceae bacterium]|nr:response regulator [Desulfobulbaceae bacterium]